MKPIVTPDNHNEWDREISEYHYQFKETLKAHLSINEYLDSKLAESSNIDWGGKYANWLSYFGIHHKTQKGWWSRRAVMPENLDLFIREMKSESDRFHNVVGEAREVIQKIKEAGTFKTELDTVKEVVEKITGEEL